MFAEFLPHVNTVLGSGSIIVDKKDRSLPSRSLLSSKQARGIIERSDRVMEGP